jgi:hypothetical protein
MHNATGDYGSYEQHKYLLQGLAFIDEGMTGASHH